jgi:hypothetical protein
MDLEIAIAVLDRSSELKDSTLINRLISEQYADIEATRTTTE